MSDERKAISIIGAGVTGTSLACLAHRAGYPIAAIASRRAESVRSACSMLGRDVGVGDNAEAARRGRLVLITTSDDAIASVCRDLAEAGAFRSDAVVAHCSGALGSDALAPARDLCAASVGSIHPMQTFPSVARALSSFAGTWCFCEGDRSAVAALTDLFSAIGGRVEEISSANKVHYHAAAVVACNYLVVLLEAAGELAKHAGIDRTQAMAALRPLVDSTVENVCSIGPTEALTGPIARGDVETVAKHLEAIGEVSKELLSLYRVMGRRALAIAEVKGGLGEDAAGRLRELLRHGA